MATQTNILAGEPADLSGVVVQRNGQHLKLTPDFLFENGDLIGNQSKVTAVATITNASKVHGFTKDGGQLNLQNDST